MKLPLKNIRGNYNKEEKQEEDNLYKYKWIFVFKSWKSIIDQLKYRYTH